VMRRTRFASELLDVAAIEPDGLLVGEDGLYVRYLQVGAVNPLVVDQAEGEGSPARSRRSRKAPDRQSLQLYVQATPLALEETLAGETQRSVQAAGTAEDSGEHLRARRSALGVCEEQSIRDTARVVCPLSLRYVVCVRGARHIAACRACPGACCGQEGGSRACGP